MDVLVGNTGSITMIDLKGASSKDSVIYKLEWGKLVPCYAYQSSFFHIKDEKYKIVKLN